MSPSLRSRPILRGAVAVALVSWGAATARADLHFTQPVQDAGEVRGGPTLVRRFEFTNKGPNTVVVTATKPSCGCLKPRLSAQHFGPGESGWVEMEVNTLSQPAGPVAWQIRVAYDDGDRPAEAVLQVRAQLTKEVSAEPAALTIVTNQAIGGEIAITDRRDRPFHLTGAAGSLPTLRAEVDPTQPDAVAGRYVVRLRVADDFPEGRHEEVVSIYTDDPAYAELKIPVTVEKRARQRVAATPEKVTMPVTAGQPLPSQLVLLRCDEGTVGVDRVVADDPAVSCRWAAGPGDMATLRVLVDAARLKGAKLDTLLHVELSGPEKQVLHIPVRTASVRP